MKKLDIFSGEYGKELKSLREHLINKNMESFPYKEWLSVIVHELLNYDSEDEERPDDYRDGFFYALKDIYSYEGVAYHGFMTNGDSNDIIKGMKTIVSYSKSIEIAYEFATSSDDFNSNIIVTNIKNGFDFGKFLNDVKDYLEEDDKVYLREEEIWGYQDDKNANIINCSNLSLEALKSALGKEC